MITVGIYGATGYTGFEVIKLLRRHPKVETKFATSKTYAGQTLNQVYPVDWNIPLISDNDAPLNEVDAVFCCLPHAASMPTVLNATRADVRVIDLSADFRLRNPDAYQQWYGVEHSAPHLLPKAVYGLTELNRAAIKETALLANPGCYPTSILLALYPLLKENLLAPQTAIIADSKSGVSGAGRKPSLKTHFAEANENLSPYNIGQKHRHLAEIKQLIQTFNGPKQVIFSPHLVPVTRGMLSTIYVELAQDLLPAQAQTLFEDIYAAESLVRVLPPGQLAGFAHTQNTNGCAISVSAVNPRRLILCSSIDNLGKGAAGQAVQNFNVMFGFEETTALI